MMHRAQQMVREFQKVAGDGLTSPAEPRLREPYLRARLIIEEATETAVALVGATRARELLREFVAHAGIDETPDIVDAIDGLCDLVYVAYGTAEAIGVDLEPFFDEVHRTNMAKAGAGRDEHGKTIKPRGWMPPRIAELLDAARRKARGVGEPPPIEKY